MERFSMTNETDFPVFHGPDVEARLYDADEARSTEHGCSEALATIVDWCESFLGKPSRLVGRSGNVCPFVPEAMLRRSLKFAEIRLEAGEDPKAGIEAAIATFRDRFLADQRRRKRIDIFASWVMVFPDVKIDDAEELIDGPQRRMKPQFVREGLMLGEFHPLSRSPGIRNAAFRPLRSPVPLLVIRHMVESDIEFLGRALDPAPLRAESLRAFLKFLGPSLSIATRLAAKEQLKLAEREMEGLGGEDGSRMAG
jgi:hypothetical protein